MNLDLTDEQAELLARELRDLIDSDRYSFSPRIRTLREILHMIRPEPARELYRHGNITSLRESGATEDDNR